MPLEVRERLRSGLAPVTGSVARVRERSEALRASVTGRIPPRARRIGKTILSDTGRHDLSGLAAELSYRLFLALFPFLILLMSLAAFIAKAAGIDNPAQQIVDAMGDALPSDTATVLQRQVDGIVNGRSAGLLSFGIIGTLWAAAGGIGAVVKATNRVFSLGESRGFVKRSLLAVGLTLTAGASLLLASIVLVGAQVFSGKIGDEIGLGNALSVVVSLARFPVAIFLILMAAEILYWAAPNNDAPFRWYTPGGMFFTLAWIVMTSLFGLYVANFGSYNATYGALAGVVVLLVWLYLSSFLLLLGAEVNAAIERDNAEQGE